MRKGQKMSDEQKRRQSKSMKGKKHTKATKKKISDTKKGRKMTEEHRQRSAEAHKGQLAWNKGGKISATIKKKISDAKKGKKHTKATKKKISDTKKGNVLWSDKSRRKLSATAQGIAYDEWESFACEKKYCPKFNEACKESNREKYGRRCFICNKTEKANGQKLSVHHVDMDKAQGCESNWKLVPLCKHCHATAHNDELVARLGYLIKEVN